MAHVWEGEIPESMSRGVVEIFLGPCVGVGGWNIPMPSVRVNSSMSRVLGWG